MAHAISAGGCCCFTTINTSDIGIIERYGKFNRLANPGCICVFCPFESIPGKISLRIQQLEVSCETKTLDNVFVMVKVNVQYQVVRDKVYQSYYALSSPEDQMKSYIYDTLRASICALTLDEAFDTKDEISLNIKQSLEAVFLEYGFGICQALVTDISPNQRVRDAMNEINSSMRTKEASYQRAEGEKTLKVKRAEAEAESMHLMGVGVARSRHAIMDGLKDSIIEFNSSVQGTSAKDVMDLLVLTQYFDALQEIGSHPKTKTIFLSADTNGPGGGESIRKGVLEADSSR